MISTFIAENYRLVQAILVVAAIACIVITALLLRARRGRRIAAVIAGAATVVVLALTLIPDKVPNDAVGCNFEPANFFGDEQNVALFFLPALFAFVAIRRPLVVLVAGIVLSALIETIQALSPVIGRRCDIDDWFANSLGVIAGVVVALVVSIVVKRTKRRAA